MLYPDDIPYLKTIKKIVSLPIGQPVGMGNLVFLYTKTIEDSIKIINEETVFSNRRKYYYYFLPGRYMGSIYGKRYVKKDLKKRLEKYKLVEEKTNLIPYKKSIVINPEEKRNTYYDLSEGLEIFQSITDKLGAKRYIQEFWRYLRPILSESYGALQHKYVLINVNQFPVTIGSLRERLNNPLYILYYTIWKVPSLISNLDIDFLFYCNGRILKVNPSKLEDKSYKIMLPQIKRIYAVASVPEIEEDEAEELEPDASEPIESRAMDVALRTSLNPTSLNITKTQSLIAKKISEKKEIIKKEMISAGADPNDIEKEIDDRAEKEAEEDEEVIKEVYRQLQEESKPQHSERSTARDKLLKEEQEKIVVGETSLKELRERVTNKVVIEKTDLESNLKTTNPNMKEIKFNNFNKTYNEKVLQKDMTETFLELNNKSIAMYLRGIDVKDTSDKLNYKETWTVHLEDENRQRHTIKVDIPKWIDDKFLYLGGDKKIIKNQDFFLPVVKIGPDTVLIVSNYNKMTINRVDTKSLRGVSVIDKLLVKSDKFKDCFTVGNSFFENHKYLTTLEYDDLSKRFRYFKMKDITLYFSQKEALEIAQRKGVTIKKTEVFIGFKGNNPIILDADSQRTPNGLGISDIIFQSLDDDVDVIRKKIAIPKRLMYTMVVTMKQKIPMGVLLCLWEGLTTVLKKAGIEYRLVDRLKDLKTTEDYIKFSNCILVYDASIPNELLLNGLKVLDTKNHELSYFDKPDAYTPFIEKKFGRATAVNMLFNEYEFMIGNIEREILKDMGVPTDIVSLMIYANKLLCDNDYVNDLDQSISRIRCGEIIPSILYDKLGKAYTTFKNSGGKKKLTLPQDAVIKELLKLKTVTSYSSLNPFLELEETHGVSYKGFRGVNLDDSYSVPKRCYDQSMVGIIAPTSSPDGNCGVNRSLTMEPNIESVRGYAKIKADKLNEVKDVNLFSPAELLIPLGVTTDDSTRTGHSVKQSRHVVPVKKSSPVLISNGSDELCKHYLSTDFVVNAKMDGKVVEKDLKTKIMVVQYKDGTYQAIDLDKRIVKNGGGGFELSNQLVTDLEVGKSFKANDTLAWHKDFFSTSKMNGTRLNIGPLTKVAICGTYNTYEDCTFITPKLSRECTTEMCFKTPAVIGKNANVSQMVKEGDEISAGDPLIQFDESFDEADINGLLDMLGEDEALRDAVISNNKNIIKSKYSGVIESIKMYSTVDLEDLSPSLQKIFGAYYKKIEAKDKLLSKYDKSGSVVKCGMLLNEPTEKVDTGRYGTIKGQKVTDGVLIEFEIKHEEPLEVGSKIA